MARYVSGSAIHDRRLVKGADGRVSFTVKNRQTGGEEIRQVSITDFLSRYLLHVLPVGLTRSRYYGWWAPRCAAQREQARQLCGAAATDTPSPAQPAVPPSAPTQDIPAKRMKCPSCSEYQVTVLASEPFSRCLVRWLPLVTASPPRSVPQTGPAGFRRVATNSPDPPSVSIAGGQCVGPEVAR